MKEVKQFQLTILQCDGSVKVYNERPWWIDVPIQSMSFRIPKDKIKKADKISKAMGQIAGIKREAYVDSLLAKGIVQRKDEKGLVTIRQVAEKLLRN